MVDDVVGPGPSLAQYLREDLAALRAELAALRGEIADGFVMRAEYVALRERVTALEAFNTWATRALLGMLLTGAVGAGALGAGIGMG